MAILRLLGREYGFYPTDHELIYQHEKIFETVLDFLNPIVGNFFVEPEEAKQKQYNELLEGHFPKFFKYFEDHLQENSSQDYLVGDSITVVDFVMFNFIHWQAYAERTTELVMPILDKFPVLKAYVETRVEVQKDYYESRPKCDS